MSNALQDFYKATISQDWSIGTGNFYVSVKPTTAPGRLVVSPSSDTLREIVEYSTTGTDANGDYIVITTRGVGGTTEQTHTIGEKVRMNITAEDWEDMRDDIDSIVAAGAVNASVTERGIVEIATDAEVLAGTETGATTAKLVVTPKTLDDNLKTIVYDKFIAPIVRVYTSNATWTKPAGLRYIEVEVQGGGGNGSNGDSSVNGSSGGSGGYAKKLISSTSLGSTETVNVGGIGGTSSFGSIISCTGGGNGSSSTTGGSAGSASGGDINISGVKGNAGLANSGLGSEDRFRTPNGANSFLGIGGSGGYDGLLSIGEDGSGYGSGGAGGGRSKNGGAGAPGIVIVKEFYI